MNFIQAMIVPTMVSMGMGSLLVAENLSLMEVSYAAPMKAISKAKNAAGKLESASAARTGDAPGLPTPADGGQSAEFGAANGENTVFQATTETELSIKAVESAGREDPFMSLVPPDPGSIVPPNAPEFPIAKLPPIAPLPTPKPVVVVPKPVPKPSAGPSTFGGDKAPAASHPQWLVRGIVSTGYERICMLEGKTGNNISARVGEQLADGSRIEAISNRGVTFIRGGRRYVKIIGGIL